MEDGCIGAPDERGAEGEVGEDSGCHFVALVVELRWWGRLLSGVKLGRVSEFSTEGAWHRSSYDITSGGPEVHLMSAPQMGIEDIFRICSAGIIQIRLLSSFSP